MFSMPCTHLVRIGVLWGPFDPRLLLTVYNIRNINILHTLVLFVLDDIEVTLTYNCIIFRML